MKFFGLDIQRQQRSAVVQQSSSEFLQVLGLEAFGRSAAGISIDEATALSVPAVFAAVNFIAGTIAGLPLNLYKRTGDKRNRVTDTPLAMLLHDAVNDETSSFDWRKHKFERILTGGRGLSFIERSQTKEITNFWALDPSKVTIKRDDIGRKTYEYRDSGGVKIYAASEVIDLSFMLHADGLRHRGPISTARDTIALGIAATRFGSKFFENGGVPPFAVTGNFQSGRAMERAAEDFAAAVRKSARESRQALVLPSGLDIKAIGTDAEKSQLVELKRFVVEEVARIYGLPPVFLQDLTHGTFTNTEQQDLQLTKHTIKRWVEHFEQELNLKLFGRGKRQFFVEFNMDGLLRGDFKTRMDGYGQAIQNGILAPNEVRQMENRPDDPAGSHLMIQGATVPISQQIKGGSNGA